MDVDLIHRGGNCKKMSSAENAFRTARREKQPSETLKDYLQLWKQEWSLSDHLRYLIFGISSRGKFFTVKYFGWQRWVLVATVLTIAVAMGWQ